jgi:hypothetical protein
LNYLDIKKLSVQAIFIVDKIKNILIFLEAIGNNFEINQKELSGILGEIVSDSRNLNINSFSHIEINKKFYFYGVFEKILIIFQHLKDKAPPEELLIELHTYFIKLFADILDNYTNNEITKFRTFQRTNKELLSKYDIYKKEMTLEKNYIIEPIERNFYPGRISVYKRDEVLWNEVKLIKQKYPTEYVNGLIFKLHVYVRISSTKWIKIYLDFSDYPLKPTIILDDFLNRELGKTMDEILYFYRTWDKTRPPHIIEIVKELEQVLWQYNSEGKIPSTSELLKIPEVKPLPNIEFLENEREKI